MKEQILIFHGYKAHGDSVWIPWLAQNLEQAGHKVLHPTLPNPAEPNLQDWKNAAQQSIASTQGPLVLIGHSLGGTLLLHLLEEDQPWFSRLSRVILLGSPCFLRETAKTFYTPGLNWEKIRLHGDKITAVWSEDDHIVPREHIEIIQKESGAQAIILNGYQHFQAKEFPWLLGELL